MGLIPCANKDRNSQGLSVYSRAKAIGAEALSHLILELNNGGDLDMSDKKDEKVTESKPAANKPESKTTVDGSSFEIVSVERRADKVVLAVRGEITVSPSEKDREKYLTTQVGSRAEFDVKPK